LGDSSYERDKALKVHGFAVRGGMLQA